MDEYLEFLESKKTHIVESGFEVQESELNPALFDFQKYCVRRMLKLGKGGIFAGCGQGKTLMQIEWANPLFGHYDRVYKSKIFTFSPDNNDVYDCEVIKGGTGYDIHTELPKEIDRLQPDYSIYPSVDDKTAYGFLTRGCPNKCKWCVVPRKEGNVHPYMDIDEITLDGRRNKVILMDNNVLASDYGIAQLEKSR